MDEQIWLEGRISIEAALIAGSRPITAVYIQRRKWDRGLQHLSDLAALHGVAVEHVDADFIARRASGASHGGVLAAAGPRRYVALDDLVSGATAPFVVMLDGIEDPFNFGQALRALYAAGVSGIVVRPRTWTSAAATVARASAGASELVALATADSAESAAAHLRARGLVVACTTRDSAVSMRDADLTVPLFLLIGGERRGITRSFLDQADLRLAIPYGRDFQQSLGVTAAAAVLGFEVLRQRTGAR